MSESLDAAEIERRIRDLMDPGERLLGAVVADDTDQGYYVLVLRDWDHPSNTVDAVMDSLRYAYLTKGGGKDHWPNHGDSQGGNGINMRDALDEEGRLLGALSFLCNHGERVQKGETDVPAIADLRGE